MKESYITPEMDVDRLEAAEDILTASANLSGDGEYANLFWTWDF